MEFVYVLQHSYEYGDAYEFIETKFIGVYSSIENAKLAIKRLQDKEGFRDYPLDCFYIDKYIINQDHWQEGFITPED